MKILITGGAGFVGSSLARLYRDVNPSAEIHCFDNLKRRGSELNLADFKKRNIIFIHGDIRNPSDFETLNSNYDIMIEASAEPSVHAGVDKGLPYLIETNLLGTFHALEFAAKHCKETIFLSTSRVYSLEPLRQLNLAKQAQRLELSAEQHSPGVSAKGISEQFSTLSARSFYGTTKLASEFLIQEYVETQNMKAAVLRCGVIAGPGQFGKVDQGVFTLWVAAHYFGMPLSYTGFGGEGLQVRDLLHPHDLFTAIEGLRPQLASISGKPINVGGGHEGSISLLELTKLCQSVSGKTIPISSKPQTHPMDVPYFVCDTSLLQKYLPQWRPKKNLNAIVLEIHSWIKENEAQLKHIFVGA